MTRVAEWWRAWIERRIPLMEPEPSGVDLLDGVGMTPVSEQDEPETGGGGGGIAGLRGARPRPTSADSHLTPDATAVGRRILPHARRTARSSRAHDSKTGRSSCWR